MLPHLGVSKTPYLGSDVMVLYLQLEPRGQCAARFVVSDLTGEEVLIPFLV